MCACVYAYEYSCPWKPEKGVGSQKLELLVVVSQPNMGAGN